MLSEIKEFLKANNFNKDGKDAYGIYRNRLITVSQKLTTISVSIAFNRAISPETAREVTSKISIIKQQHPCLVQGLTSNVALTLIMYQIDGIYNEFRVILDSCLTVLDESAFPTCEICPVCGGTLSTTDPFLKTRFGVIQLHGGCASQVVKSADNIVKNQNIKNKKKSFLSYLFAIVIPLFFVLFDVLLVESGSWTFVFVLQSWASFFIYRFLLLLLKCPNGKKQVIAISISSLVGIFISAFLCILVDMKFSLPDYTYPQLLQQYFNILARSFDTYTADVIIYIGIALLICMLNIFSSYMMIRQFENGSFRFIDKNQKMK